MSDTIQVTETSRIRIETQPAPENPRKDWDMMTGFVKIKGMGDRNIIDVEAVHVCDLDLADALYRFETARPTLMYPEDLVIRWARVFHNTHIEYDEAHGGFWFVEHGQMQANFPDAGDGVNVKRFRQVVGAPINTYEDYLQPKLECEAEVIKQERATYQAWADGEVYGVIFERARQWAPLDNDGDPILDESRYDWEEIDSCWGEYLNDSYIPEAAALELDVDFTDEEKAVLLAAREANEARQLVAA